MTTRSRWTMYLACSFVVVAATTSSAQTKFSRGQNVVPVFEGWQRNLDGTFSLWFGYLNRNWEEELNIPIGPNNTIEPGGPDRGQTAYFYPRRDRFVFSVTVPTDWPKDKDVVWTLTAHGKAEKAYGSLWPVWEIDDSVITANRGGSSGLNFDPNTRPVITRPPSDQTVTLGSPVKLSIAVTDDGMPRKTRAQEPRPPIGLKITWIQFRGPGTVIFKPGRVVPITALQVNTEPPVYSGEGTATALFDEPGVYVLRAFAEDGGLFTTRDVTITVNPATSSHLQR